MWFFKSSVPIADSGILHGMTDCHSHLLPGVDDGVKTEEETWRILDEMERQGVRKVWLTPHIMEDMPNETAALQQKFLRLKQKYQGKVELALAAEYMLDNLFEERLEKDDLLPLEEGKRYLSGNFLFQSTNGATVYFATHPKKRLLSIVGPSGTV